MKFRMKRIQPMYVSLAGVLGLFEILTEVCRSDHWAEMAYSTNDQTSSGNPEFFLMVSFELDY